MVRKIIKINDDLCDGCGECVVECAEGALQIIDGKARLVKEQFCDGFGDCVGNCPAGALTIEEREADEFDYEATKAHLWKSQGTEAVWRLEDAQKQHKEKEENMHMGHGCPGAQAHTMNGRGNAKPSGMGPMEQVIPSELSQWPVQIHLVQPGMPAFRNKELVIMNTCGPLASADVHWRYLRGRSVVVGCPKLDDTSPYAAKLGEILKEGSIPKVIVVRMEVPCCGGLTKITAEGVQRSGREDLPLEEHILGIDGSLKHIRRLEIRDGAWAEAV